MLSVLHSSSAPRTCTLHIVSLIRARTRNTQWTNTRYTITDLHAATYHFTLHQKHATTPQYTTLHYTPFHSVILYEIPLHSIPLRHTQIHWYIDTYIASQNWFVKSFVTARYYVWHGHCWLHYFPCRMVKLKQYHPSFVLNPLLFLYYPILSHEYHTLWLYQLYIPLLLIGFTFIPLLILFG